MASKKEHKNSFPSRLNDAFDKSNYNKSTLAKALNVTHTTVSRWLSGQKPNGDSLYGLASLMNKNVEWLLTGKGPETPSNSESALARKEELNAIKKSNSIVEIPVLSWAHAGEITDYEEMPIDYLDMIPLSADFVRKRKLGGLITRGDSMVPRIEQGDKLVLDLDTEASSGEIVVAKFHESEGVQIRRYQILSTNKGKAEKIKLLPYNEFYEATAHHISEFAWIKPVVMVIRERP